MREYNSFSFLSRNLVIYIQLCVHCWFYDTFSSIFYFFYSSFFCSVFVFYLFRLWNLLPRARYLPWAECISRIYHIGIVLIWSSIIMYFLLRRFINHGSCVDMRFSFVVCIWHVVVWLMMSQSIYICPILCLKWNGPFAHSRSILTQQQHPQQILPLQHPYFQKKKPPPHCLTNNYTVYHCKYKIVSLSLFIGLFTLSHRIYGIAYNIISSYILYYNIKKELLIIYGDDDDDYAPQL